MRLINKDFNKNFYFYKLPKKLFKPPYNKLSSNAKLCYRFLLDRINLSKSNNIIDDEDNVYIYYTKENMQKELNISKATAIKVFRELVQVHLIKQVKDKHAYNIYLYDVFDDNYKVEKLNKKGTDSETNKVQNLYQNKNKYNNNYKSKSSYLNYEQRQYPDDFFNQFYANFN